MEAREVHTCSRLGEAYVAALLDTTVFDPRGIAWFSYCRNDSVPMLHANGISSKE